MLEPGKRVTEQLRLIRKLGEGGMGSVWVAYHQSLETEVAVKFLNPELADDQLWLARFRREAQAIAKIDSAHVVRVFDNGVTADNHPFIVMELLRGEDLRQRVAYTQRLSVDEVLVILDQVGKALSRAHQLGIVHRDVKPENIFLTREGSDLFVKVLDFGVAKQTLSSDLAVTDSRTMIGTPYYMSPEQVLNTHEVDHRADLWALAVVAYQMLTGFRPFVGGTLGAIHVQINSGEYRPVTTLRPDLPATVDEWFGQALNRKLERRFASVQQFVAAFRIAVGAPQHQLGFPSAAPSSDTMPVRGGLTRTAIASVRTIARQSRPSNAFLAIGIAAVLVGVVVAGPLLWSRGQIERQVVPTSAPDLAWSIERTVGSPGGSSATAPATSQNSEKSPAPASSATGMLAPIPKVPILRVKGQSALPSAEPRSAVPSAPQERPIKDRGF